MPFKKSFFGDFIPLFAQPAKGEHQEKWTNERRDFL